MLSVTEIERFAADGYLILRGLVDAERCSAMVKVAQAALREGTGPAEYEADVHYPGAPPSRAAPGGGTVRRLLQAYARHPLFREWALDPAPVRGIRALLGAHLVLPQAHHNCVMTKQPQFSSDTGWHQDIRYWSFARPDLISVWLALTPETPENGCLYLLPGTHKTEIAPERLDKALFLRSELAENQRLIAARAAAQLDPGDVLFFHARVFHAASRNQTDRTKFSLVYTYRPADNLPLPGTRSASMPEISIA